MLTLLRRLLLLLLLLLQVLVVVDLFVLLQALHQPLGADVCSRGVLNAWPSGLQLPDQQVRDLRILGVLTGTSSATDTCSNKNAWGSIVA